MASNKRHNQEWLATLDDVIKQIPVGTDEQIFYTLPSGAAIRNLTTRLIDTWSYFFFPLSHPVSFWI
jgi:hypothetical protein